MGRAIFFQIKVRSRQKPSTPAKSRRQIFCAGLGVIRRVSGEEMQSLNYFADSFVLDKTESRLSD